MTLKELVEHITWMMTDRNENDVVKIQIRSAGSIGATPTVDIKNVTAGFDWDSGKIIITPATELQEFDPPAHKKIMEMYDKVGLIQMENRNLKRENAKLKEILGVKKIMYIKCKPYGYSSSPVFIMKDKIIDWYYIYYNGRSGTCIRTIDGKQINVDEYPEDIAKKVVTNGLE